MKGSKLNQIWMERESVNNRSVLLRNLNAAHFLENNEGTDFNRGSTESMKGGGLM